MTSPTKSARSLPQSILRNISSDSTMWTIDYVFAQFFCSSFGISMTKKLLLSQTRSVSAKRPGNPCRLWTSRYLHEEYKDEGGHASFSTFAKCRSAHVRKMIQSQLRQCLCEYCANVQLKINKINDLASKSHIECRIRHVYHAVQLTVCEDGGKDCAYRQCENCGVQQMKDFLAPLNNDDDTIVTWHAWKTRKVSMAGKEVSRKILATESGSVAELISQLPDKVKFLSEHLFHASWQHKQFQKLQTALPFPTDTVAVVMDFAENYACQFQEEVQSAHWHHQLVTIHPISCYYRCSHCEDKVYESVIFVTDDQQHDHHAVHTFFTLAVNHLRVERHLDPTLVLQWTDGAASQYKSKGPFADIAASDVDFGMRVERCFFGSRHGKGPCDGESAVDKHHAATAVKAQQAIIATAKDFFEYGANGPLTKNPDPNKCSHFVRKFIWVPADMIERNRPTRMMKTVKGTRNFHHIKSGGEGRLVSRHLTCVCPFCMHGQEPACPNANIVGDWKEHTLVPDDKRIEALTPTILPTARPTPQSCPTRSRRPTSSSRPTPVGKYYHQIYFPFCFVLL